MEFLDKTGVQTLWGKIKTNFVQILDTSQGGQNIPSASYGIRLYTGDNWATSDNMMRLTPIELNVYNNLKEQGALSPQQLFLRNKNQATITITPSKIAMFSTAVSCDLTPDHSSRYEYAKPIQDLESILV